MDILFVSSLCSNKQNDAIFKEHNRLSSYASQKFNKLFVTGLLENDCKVDALSQRILHSKSYAPINETEKSVQFTYLHHKKNRSLNRISVIIEATKKIIQWCKAHKKGIVICDTIIGELSIAVLIASKLIKNVTIAIVTDVPSIRANDNRKGLKSIPVKIKNSLIYCYDSYVFLTEEMNSLFNTHNKPYVVIEGMVDEKAQMINNTLDLKSDKKICMMAGLLDDIYGVDSLIKAFSNLEYKDVELVFYGRGNSVQRIIETAKNDGRIKYKGELPNEEIMREECRASLLINPRNGKGDWTKYSFPSKNMEYIASGTPMLAFALPSMPSEYYPFFYHFEKDDIDSMTHVLKNVLSQSNKELYDFGKMSQKWIHKEKSSKKQIEKVVRMIRRYK